MMQNFPSRQTLTTFLKNVWQILFGGIRVFAWDSLKGGFIDIRPLPRVARLLALMMLAIILIFSASILFNDTLRFSGTLIFLPLSSIATNALFVPSTAVPVSYLASLLAWTLLFTGALRVRPLMRWTVLILFLFFVLPNFAAGGLNNLFLNSDPLLFPMLGLAALCVIGIVTAFVALPRRRASLLTDFLCMFVLVGGFYLIHLLATVRFSQATGTDFVSQYLVPSVVVSPRYLIIPLIFLSGAEMIGFATAFTGWGAQSAERYGSASAIRALLLGVLAWRWLDFFWNTILPGVATTQWLPWAGAVLAGVCLIPIALWRRKYPMGDHVPLKLVLGLIIGMMLAQFVILAIILVIGALFNLVVTTNVQGQQAQNTFTTLLAFGETYRDLLQLFIAFAGAGITFIAYRRKRYTVAAYGMILGWTELVWWLMETGRPLQNLRYQYSDMDKFLLLALTAVTVYWLWQHQLTAERALRLLGLVLFVWVLNNTSFIDNPLALFFGFTGVFFTIFGILWGVLTAGGKFANFDSPQFPRINRILLYLGYVLLTISVTHWFIVTHNLPEQALNNSFNASGLRIFGYTAAYLVIVEGGRALLKKEA